MHAPYPYSTSYGTVPYRAYLYLLYCTITRHGKRRLVVRHGVQVRTRTVRHGSAGARRRHAHCPERGIPDRARQVGPVCAEEQYRTCTRSVLDSGSACVWLGTEREEREDILRSSTVGTVQRYSTGVRASGGGTGPAWDHTVFHYTLVSIAPDAGPFPAGGTAWSMGRWGAGRGHEDRIDSTKYSTTCRTGATVCMLVAVGSVAFRSLPRLEA